jgi:Flp pilus assembly pilin Flp
MQRSLCKVALEISGRLRRREEGATAVEYALMIIMVAFVILAAAAVLGSKVFDMFNDAATQL